ncbi:MAG: YncE family protein [Alphaproteobacteria bacterium]|nr:YncE family protein [Alphaproteobacteria bacterium]
MIPALARLRSSALLGAALAIAFSGIGWAKTAVVLNSEDDSISIVDTASYAETARVHVGRSPHHLIVTPDGQTLIIAMAGGNELAFIERSTGKVRRRLAASDPYQVGFSRDGKWFVATSLRLDRVDIYDGENFELLHRLPAPSMPSHIAFSPDNGTVYVSLQGTKNLMAIDLAAGKTLWTAQIGPDPAGVLTRPDGTLLVGIMGSDHVALVDPKDGAVIRRIRTGRGAHNFLVSPDGKTLYVSNRVAGTISVLDADTLAVTGTLTAPGGPDDMALSPDGRELWVTGRWRAFVNVIERESGDLKATIQVGRSPHGIYVY